MMGHLTGYLTKKVQWATWQFSVLKLSMVTFGIILGSYFAGFWKPLILPLGAVFIASSVWASVMWLQQVISTNNRRVMKK